MEVGLYDGNNMEDNSMEVVLNFIFLKNQP